MKHLVWIMVVCGMLYACAKPSGYTIKGEVAGADGQKVVLQQINIDSRRIGLDSCVVKNGKFEMKGTVEYPEYAAMYIGNNGPILFFVEDTIIHVAVNVDTLYASKISGSKETDLFADLNKGMMAIDKRVNKINDDYMSLKLSGVNDVEKEKDLLAQMEQMQQERIDFMTDFVQQHPNSIVSALVIDRNLSYYSSLDQMEVYANGFDVINSKSQWVQSIKEKVSVAKRLQEGQPFLDITLSSPDGTPVALSDYAGKNKYVVIDFWAGWCMPCRMANPLMVKLYNRYKDKDFEIVGISLDKDKQEWIKAIEDDQLPWPQMSDLKYWQSEAAQLYAVNSIPYTILLDKDGKILAKGLHAQELEKKLAELFE